MKRLLTATAATMALAVPVLATQIEYRSPQRMGRDASLVVRGRVASVRAHWDAAHRYIVTEARVQVGASYKGTAPAEVRVVQPGGVVGHVRMTVHGAPAWKPGDEFVLFLEPADGGEWMVSGLSAGRVPVERDARTGEAFVRWSDPGTAGPEAAAPSRAGSQRRTQRLPLSRFMASVVGLGEGGAR